MAITNFNELQSATMNWLDRTDSSFTPRIPEFIVLAESAINRRLRVQDQITTAILSFSLGSSTLPADYLEWKRVTRLTSVSQTLEWAEPELLATAYQHSVFYLPNVPLNPGLFTIEGSAVKVRPIDDSSTVEFLYYAKIPALTTSGSTNWLLAAHPDVYLAATLAEAMIFSEGPPDLATLWK